LRSGVGTESRLDELELEQPQRKAAKTSVIRTTSGGMRSMVSRCRRGARGDRPLGASLRG
jgi:hypothetical protein